MTSSSQPFRADLAETKRKRREQRRRLVISFAFGLGLALMALGVWGWGYLFADLPRLPSQAQLWSMNRAPGITFLDRTGALVATRGPKHGQRVRLSEMPAYVPRAFLAAEDRRFYQHGPIEVRSTLRALTANVESGEVVQGGSTITQQLARTLFLSNERTTHRKLQEALVAFRLEGRLTKDEVLELYLNRIYYGASAYGVEAAAQTYFAKSARTLTLSEAALLASLPKAPSRLALNNDLDGALARSRLVLAAMRQEGWITPAQQAAALSERPTIASPTSGEADFGYILDMATAEAALLAGGKAPDLVVRLSVDATLQRRAQALLKAEIAERGAKASARQGALVVLAPDGAIRALTGGVDYRQSPFNRAVQAQRQPGSAYKPFVFAAALEKGVTPEDTRQDAPFRVGEWSPRNYEGGYRGAVTVQEALAQSINTVAARLGSEVGRQRLGETARRFGLASIPENPELPVALGAYEVNLLELTSAYQVFQNAGARSPPYLIEAITTARGDPLFLRRQTSASSVYDPARAGAMVRMMAAVIERGTGLRAQIARPAAGKTGTSQNWRDAWFVGFTPDFAAGVWIGNDDAKPMAKVAGGAMPADLWRELMLAAHEGLPVRDFEWMGPGQGLQPLLQDALPDPRNPFYETLASEFDRVAADAGAEATSADPGLRKLP